MEIVNENIEYEQLLGENSVDTIIRQDYLIPDTHPDLGEILMVDARPSILSKEIMQGKIYIEGEVEYSIMYLSKTERGNEVFTITYDGKFSNAVDIEGAEKDMMCDVKCYVEYIDSNISNERKIMLEGIIKLKAQVYKKYNYSIVKDVKDSDNLELLKNPTYIDKIVSSKACDLTGKAHIVIGTGNPEIDNILNCHINICKEEVVLYKEKLKVSCTAHITLVYKHKDSRDVTCIEQDTLLTKEIEDKNIDEDMKCYSDFCVEEKQIDVKDNELGEKRIIDVEILAKCNTKVMSKEQINMIEDAYSPLCIVNVDKNNYPMNVLHECTMCQALAKGEITIEKDMPSPEKIICCSGYVNITDKKIVEDKVLIEGVVNSRVLYYSKNNEKYIYCVSDNIEFNCDVEIPGAKIDMMCMAAAKLESIDAVIEPGQIAVKAVINVYVKVSYLSNKDFITNIEMNENEIPQKKASITIYVVQNGDTLWKIAKNYNTKVEDLVKVNNIEDANSIKVGNKLIIPGRAII